MEPDPTAWSATEQARALRGGDISARELMAATLARIESANPALNALVTLADPSDLLAQAAAADDRLTRGGPVGPLHGLPLGVKDSEPVAGMRTTWGSPLFAEHVPVADSPLVARERAAGAIIVGKTNVPEFAAGSHTFNTVFGATRNPHDPDRSAGGSSGGGAAALAAGMISLADGSDLGGSLRNPASFCGVVGFRPSQGLVPSPPGRGGPSPWAHATHGPLGRTVADTGLLLEVQVGRALEPTPTNLGEARVAWCPGFGLPFEQPVRDAVDHLRPILQGVGCVVVDDEPDLAGADDAFQVFRARLLAEELGDLYLEKPEAFKATLRWNIDLGLALTEEDLERAQLLTAQVRAAVGEFMARTGVDVLALPTSQVLPFPLETEYPTVVDGVAMGNYVDWMRSCSWMSVTGHPSISIPAGLSVEGLPVGVQLVGRAGGDAGLLGFAAEVEALLRVKGTLPA